MNESEKGKIERLNESLYSRTHYKDPLEKRSEMEAAETAPVEEKWQSGNLDQLLTMERKPEEAHPLLKKFFIFAALFFVAAVVVAGLVFFGGVNFVSSKNVDINIVGPTAASAGETLDLGVTIENKNNTALELANFSVQFPQGSRDPEDSSKALTYLREDLGAIGAGDEAVRNVSVVLLGSRGESKEFKFSVEYKVKGSNATFYKEKFYTVTIGNAPLTLEVQAPRQVISGEVFETEATVTLNSPEILRGVLLKAEYPYGYSVTESAPQAVAENNLWSLGDLAPGAKKTVKIKGRLTGENREERTFRFYIGVSDGGNITPNFKTIILSDQETIAIERPSVGLNIVFNGDTATSYVAPVGKNIQVSVRFQNNMAERLLGPKLEARFTGSALNKSSVLAQNGGLYSSSANRITWALSNTRGMNELSPGEGGQVVFNFASLPETSGTAGQEIGLQFTLSGTPVGSLQPLTINESRTVKIAAQVNLASRTVYSLGPFVNSGPVPPQIGATTTYTIIWSAGNTQGDILNAKVSARLGANVKWAGAKSFESEDISYDTKTNTVTWNLGTLSAEAGFSTPAREVAFQVALLPVSGQAGSAPTLVSGAVFSGNEAGGRTLTATNGPLTTKMPSDPTFIQGDDIVVK